MSTARDIHQHAPIGALIRFGNNQPRPPERHKIKLRAWEAENGTGCLTGRNPATGSWPGTFTLHLGDYGSGDVTMMVMNRIFSTASTGTFEIIETPEPGMVLVLSGEGGYEELRHLAPDMAAAERWMATNRYCGMRIEVVPDPEAQVAPEIEQGLTASADEHYSDLTLKALVGDYGWQATSDHVPLVSVQRTFPGVGLVGGMIVPDGRRNLVAGYARDALRRRYISLSLGDTEITDIDGRGEDPAQVARRINGAAERYADERRARNGLPAFYAEEVANDTAISVRSAA